MNRRFKLPIFKKKCIPDSSQFANDASSFETASASNFVNDVKKIEFKIAKYKIGLILENICNE